MDIKDIRKARAERAREIPAGNGRMHSFPSKLRAKLVEKDGKKFYEVDGYATIFNKPYEMYDMFGSYREVADETMLDKSLAAKPDVAFLLNHKGMTMARTANGTLDLNKDALGLHIHGLLNAERQDVRDLASAIDDKLVDEMSFAFMLNDGEWNTDYDEFRITEADINRGDVSAVNFGANPYTSLAARSAEWLAYAELMPAHVARAGYLRLGQRQDVTAMHAPGREAYRPPQDDAPEARDQKTSGDSHKDGMSTDLLAKRIKALSE